MPHPLSSSYLTISEEARLYRCQWRPFVVCWSKRGVKTVRHNSMNISKPFTLQWNVASLFYADPLHFHIHSVEQLDIIKAFYSLIDAQVNCLKNNFKNIFKTIHLGVSWWIKKNYSILFTSLTNICIRLTMLLWNPLIDLMKHKWWKKGGKLYMQYTVPLQRQWNLKNETNANCTYETYFNIE